MSYDGAIIALDLASRTGVADGCPGEIPRFETVQFRKPDDSYEETWGRAVRWMATKLHEPRTVGGVLYGPGRAASEGLIRVVVEAPVFSHAGGHTSHDALLISKCLWASVTGFANARHVMVIRGSVSTVRKHFLGAGNIPKETAKRRARDTCRALGWDPPNLDCADAGALWHWAAHQWNPAAVPQVSPLFLHQARAA